MSNPVKRIPAFAAAFMLTGCFFASVEAKEPYYNGKPLSEIICCGLPDDQYDAFAHLGTNSLPVVLDLMGATDKKMKRVAMRYESEPLREMASSEDEGFVNNIREGASKAFDILGTNAVSAIPRLVKILNENDDTTSIYAADALGKVGPQGFVALTNVLSKAGRKENTRSAAVAEIVDGDFTIVGPMLNGFLKDKNPDVRRFAAGALAGRDPDTAIPLLIPVLDDPDMEVKAAAATALGSYGAKAMSAVPKIASTYTNSVHSNPSLDIDICRAFSGSLKAIDLEAAEKSEALIVSNPINPYRSHYTSTRLPNGLELIAGGYIRSDILYPSGQELSNAQLYDPKTGKWTETGSMKRPRSFHGAALLPGGDVLIAGGADGRSAELYDPTTGKWTETGSLKNANGQGQILLQPDGKALFVNGIDYPNRPPFDKELYDPATGTWEEATNK